MGLLIVNDVLMDVSYALLEFPVATTMTAAIGQGAQTASVGSTAGMYVGALVVVGTPGSGTEEVVAITAFDPVAATFTATFANAHNAGETVLGATFPSGQDSGNPLFTQTEMLEYAAEAQNEFLLKTRCIYADTTIAAKLGVPVYDNPPDAIRIERLANAAGAPNTGTAGSPLWDTERFDIDTLLDVQQTVAFWRDKTGNAQFSVGPVPPQVGGNWDCFYSQRGPNSLALDGTFLLPDPLTIVVKYGVLARAWSKDGEQRDPKRAQFAQQFMDFGVLFVRRFVAGLETRLGFEAEIMDPLLNAKGA